MAIVYQHRRKDNNEIFYIGISKHFSRPYEIFGRNKLWKRIVNKYGFIIEIIDNDITWEDACKKEKELILQYGRIDLKTGTLCNLTDGGEGQENPSEETRKKMSIARKNRITKLETRKKLSESKKNKKRPDSSIRLSNLNKLDWMRLKNSESKLGSKNPMFGKTPKNAKQIEDINTGKVFKSKLEASKYYKISTTKLNSLLNKKQIVKYKL